MCYAAGVVPPSFEIGVASECVCARCRRAYPFEDLVAAGATLSRSAPVEADAVKVLVLRNHCRCGGSTFLLRVRIGAGRQR